MRNVNTNVNVNTNFMTIAGDRQVNVDEYILNYPPETTEPVEYTIESVEERISSRDIYLHIVVNNVAGERYKLKIKLVELQNGNPAGEIKVRQLSYFCSQLDKSLSAYVSVNTLYKIAMDAAGSKIKCTYTSFVNKNAVTGEEDTIHFCDFEVK